MKNHEIFWLSLMLLAILSGIVSCYYYWWLEYKYEKIGRNTRPFETPAAVAKLMTILISVSVIVILFNYILTNFNAFLNSL